MIVNGKQKKKTAQFYSNFAESDDAKWTSYKPYYKKREAPIHTQTWSRFKELKRGLSDALSTRTLILKVTISCQNHQKKRERRKEGGKMFAFFSQFAFILNIDFLYIRLIFTVCSSVKAKGLVISGTHVITTFLTQPFNRSLNSSFWHKILKSTT